MHQSKVCFVIDGHKIVIILIHLDRRQLTFVNDISVAERANVEPRLPPRIMGHRLSQDVQFPLELYIIKLLSIFLDIPYNPALDKKLIENPDASDAVVEEALDETGEGEATKFATTEELMASLSIEEKMEMDRAEEAKEAEKEPETNEAILGCLYLFWSLPVQTQTYFLIWNVIGLAVDETGRCG